MQCRRWCLLRSVHCTYPHLTIIAFPFLQPSNSHDSKCKDALFSVWLSNVWDLPDISVVYHQVLHRNLQNITQEVTCLLPFMPLKKLTELLDGETVLRNIRSYGDVLWSPQQVCVSRNLYLHLKWHSSENRWSTVLQRRSASSFSFHSH